MTEFTNEINSRISQTRESLRQAREADEPYLVEVRLGELESLARLAADHGLVVDGVSESLAEYGLPTPAVGLPTVVDITDRRLDLADQPCDTSPDHAGRRSSG